MEWQPIEGEDRTALAFQPEVREASLGFAFAMQHGFANPSECLLEHSGFFHAGRSVSRWTDAPRLPQVTQLTRQICVITAGHLSNCPRMLKAADALLEAGYNVRVVSTKHLDWAWAADQEVRKTRAWPWQVVDYDRSSGRRIYYLTGIRSKVMRWSARLLGPQHLPLALAARAFGRVHTELLRAALEEPADLFYAGTNGALAAAAFAGKRTGVPYALDLEDFHSGEPEETPAGQRIRALVERIEHAILPGAAFLTAGSAAIGAAYLEKYGVHPLTISNTFPLPSNPPDCSPSKRVGLQLYWFSQTIGPGRGLEDAVRSMGLANVRGALHLRGRAVSGYLNSLRDLAGQSAPQLELVHHEPAPPDAMIDLCRGYDVGLALEPGFSINNRLALTNKILTYMLAGLAVAVTDTPGQRSVAEDLGKNAILYTAGDVTTLAAGLKGWAEDKELLARAKMAAWGAAERRWHWEHPLERGILLAAVAGVLS